VLRIGGEQEVTQEQEECSSHVIGVVSKLYAYLMNQAAGDDITHPAVAMTGRVPIRVVGRGSKGDRLVSAGNGCARVAHLEECTAFNVIGRLLVNKETDGEELAMSVVSVNK